MSAAVALCTGLTAGAAAVPPAVAEPPALAEPSAVAEPPAASGRGPTVVDPSPAVVDLGVTDALALLESGATTSVALTRRYLDRIAAYDDPSGDEPGLAAVVRTHPEALATAATLDAERAAGRLRGPLHGVPIVVKDNYATADLPTSAGSVALEDYRTHHDSTAVRRLRKAGAIVLAKTNTSEFAWHGTYTLSSVRGRTRNPYDRSTSASGSSGGTGAAVAAAYAPAGLGTDSCGSILGPSAHQGLVGLRPTRGLTSLAGIVPLSPRQDASGPMTTSVRDAALLLEVLAGRDPADPLTVAADEQPTRGYVAALDPTALRGVRIGVVRWEDDPARPGHADTTAVVDAALEDLRAQGAEVVELPDLTREWAEQHLPSGGWLDMRASIDAFLAGTPATWPEGLAGLTEPRDVLTFSDVVADGRTSLTEADLETFLAPPDLPNDAHDAAGVAQEAGRAALDAFFAEHGLDALAMPTSTGSATDRWAGTNSCDLTANTGAPSITVPAGATSTGAPVGLQLVAPRHHDAHLLAMAYAYEQATRHRVAPASTPELPPAATPVATGPEALSGPATAGLGALVVALVAAGATAHGTRRRDDGGAPGPVNAQDR